MYDHALTLDQIRGVVLTLETLTTEPEDVIRGRKLTDLESMTMSIPDIPIWTDDGMIIAPITDNGTIPLDSSIEYMILIEYMNMMEQADFPNDNEEDDDDYNPEPSSSAEMALDILRRK